MFKFIEHLITLGTSLKSHQNYDFLLSHPTLNYTRPSMLNFYVLFEWAIPYATKLLIYITIISILLSPLYVYVCTCVWSLCVVCVYCMCV
jgi:hypothetical protein